jgi:hypothetical protein
MVATKTFTTGGGSGTTYVYEDTETTAIYKYYGFSTSTGWRISRKTLATSIWLNATGTGTYATAWADRASKVYS